MADRATYRISRQHAVDANRLWYRSAVRSRKGIGRLTLFSALITVAATWWLGEGATPSVRLAIAAGTLLYCAGIFGLIILSNYLLLPRRAGRLYDQQRSLQHDVSLAWNDEAFHIETAASRSTHRWTELRRWQRGRGLFLFYLNDVLYHLVPEDALTDAQRDDLDASVTTACGAPGRAIAARAATA